MSLGTDALKVGREPKRIRHSKEVSLANLRTGTTPACSRQLKEFSGNTHLHRRGGTGWEPVSTKIHLRDRSTMISPKNASVRCNLSPKITKRPLRSLHNRARLRRRPLTTLACNFTLSKLHLATLC